MSAKRQKKEPTITLRIVEGPITPLQRQLTDKFWTKLIAEIKRSEAESDSHES